MTIKVKSLVPNLGANGNPVGTVLELDAKVAEDLISKRLAEKVEETSTEKQPASSVSKPKTGNKKKQKVKDDE